MEVNNGRQRTEQAGSVRMITEVGVRCLEGERGEMRGK